MLSEKNLQKAVQKRIVRIARIALHSFIREYQNEKEDKDIIISYYKLTPPTLRCRPRSRLLLDRPHQLLIMELGDGSVRVRR